MIRFRNPVSDIEVIINVFKSLYSEFSNVEYFDLDNIAEFLAREKLASSSGYTGDEALKRSYQIKDDSRKSMKMQAKSYTEIYRVLGWIHSKEEIALNFTFTYLGLHVALSGDASKDLYAQCLLGIIYPNKNLDVKFDDINKPFISILQFAKKLEGKINRDEIILGPMNLMDGKSFAEIDEKLQLIKSLRITSNINNLNAAISDLSDSLSMKPNSVRNLTRFVISSIVYTGWFEKKKLNIYGKKSNFLVLTFLGEKVCNQIDNSINVYGRDLPNDIDKLKQLSELSFLTMLKYADFDVQEDLEQYIGFKNELLKTYNKDEPLFSPFQYFSSKEIKEIMPDKILNTSELNIETNISVDNIQQFVYKSNKTISYLVSENNAGYLISENNVNNTVNEIINKYFKDNKNIEKSIENFLIAVSGMKQTDFYPLVADMLSYIFDKKATTSPSGNNNMRYDVIIKDAQYSIPVEVKSPTEEIMLSVKAIRQALENKVLLLSRRPFPTTYDLCSMAIGFSVPNKRSDVYKLIEDIYKTYKINIAIADIKDLLIAMLYCYNNSTRFNISDFENYKGRILFNYEDI